MSEFTWLSKHRFQEVVRRQHDWNFVLHGNTSIVVWCLWRLLEEGRIRFTSNDEGQQFGLNSAINLVNEINKRLSGVQLVSGTLHPGLLDLEIRFATGHVLQLIPDSSGYEAWSIDSGESHYTAVGGGDLAIMRDEKSSH